VGVFKKPPERLYAGDLVESTVQAHSSLPPSAESHKI
jgi:hypothetical protein